MPLLKGMLQHTKYYNITLLLLCFSPLCLAKQIAITFDDAPRKAEGYLYRASFDIKEQLIIKDKALQITYL